MKKTLAEKQLFIYKPNLRISTLFFAGLLTFSAFILASGVVTAKAAQSDLTGEWSARLDTEKPGMLNIIFTRRPNITTINQTGKNIALNELQNLSPQTIASGGPNVNFRIVREAGTFEFEGLFKDGRGVGFWTLTPNQSFVSAMRNRGYDNLTENDLMSAVLSNLTAKFIEDLKSVGYGSLEFGKLLRAGSRNVTPDFIRDVQSAGFGNLTIDQIISAKTHNINSDFVKQVKAMGFGQQSLESLIKMRKDSIDAEFVSQMRSAGFENLSIEQLIKLRNNKITTEFVNDIKAEGYSKISAEEAIRLKSNKVDRDFIRLVKANRMSHVPLEQIIKLRRQNTVK